MSGANTPLSILLSIGGVSVPASGFDVSSGSFGSVGHATITMSIKILREQGIDLVSLGASATQVPVSVAVLTTGASGVVFGGEYVSSSWNFSEDTVTVHCRDWAGVLVDQKRVLTRDVALITSALAPISPGQNLQASGISTMNRKVSQVVTDVANEFGFTPQVQMVSGTDVTAGSIYGSTDHVFMTIPQSLWSVLNTLARDTGNEVYTTPDRKLVFGQPGFGQTPITLSWNLPKLMSQSSPQGMIPCDGLSIDHSPRRNNTFRILVISYDPGRAVTVLGRATYVSDTSAQGTLKVGLYTGADAITADTALAAAASNKQTGSPRALGQVQVYTFHWDGLTQDAATARAAAIATDISKRLLTLRTRIDGYPAMLPTLPFTIVSPDVPPIMASNTWYVAGYRHTFRIPGKRSSEGGFWTEISALDLPSVALAGGTTR